MAYIDKATGLIVPGGEPCDMENSGSSGGTMPDLSGLTVKASDVSQGVTYYGSNGRGTGTMPDVSVSISGRNVTVPAGRIRTSQSLTVSSGSFAINGGTVNVSAGYVENQTLNVSAGSVAVNGGTVNVSAGYVNSGSLAIPAGGVQIAGDKVNVSAGYIGSQTLTVPAGGISIDGGTVNISAGYVSSGTLEVPAGELNVYDNYVVLGGGYYAAKDFLIGNTVNGYTVFPNDREQKISSGSYLIGDVVVMGDSNLIPANIIQGKSIFGVEGSAKTGADTSDANTVTSADVSENLVFYNAAGRQVGTMPDVEVSISGPDVTVPAGRIRTSQSLAVSAGSVAVNGGTVNVSAGYVENQTLNVSAGGVSIDGDKVNVSAGYVESQTLNVSPGLVAINEVRDKVLVERGYVETQELPIPDGSAFYQCADVHFSDGENVYMVSGAGTKAVNGSYVYFGSSDRGTFYKNSEISSFATNYFLMVSSQGDLALFDLPTSEDPLVAVAPAFYRYSAATDSWSAIRGAEPFPTVTTEMYSYPISWDGYKAEWNADNGTYVISNELITGLNCGAYFTPEVGKIYPADTRVIVERLWQTSAGDVSRVSFSYYQCAAVYGPHKVDGFIVSGAGKAEVNGNYLLTDLKTEEDTPIYKHETAEYYYFEMWGEKGICTSPTQYPSEGLYYNMYDEGWYPGSGEAEPAPTVTAGMITVDADVPKTWSGYGVYWSEDEGYKFSETLTTCLSYGTWLIPELGKVYDAQARVEVSKLFESVKPITTNDTACLIYIDGTSLSNQGKAPNKHEVTFGSGVSLQNGYVNMTNDESGQILTTARSDGYGGSLAEWTWDYYFLSDANSLDCSGHSGYGWCIEGNPGQELYFRGHSKKFGVVRQQNQLVALSLQYDNGNVHVWNSGKYVKSFAWNAPNCDGIPFGIGCIADGDYDRMADNIKLFRFSNKARYVPGQDFELPEGFI